MVWANIKYFTLLTFLRIVALLPLKLLYGLSDCLAFVAHRIVRYRLKVVRKNLHLVYPDMADADRLRLEKKFYAYLGDVIVETIKLLHISDENLRRRIKIENDSLVASYASQNRPIILFLAHYGNWEWVPALTLTVKRPSTMGALYKPLRNKVMDRVMLRLRNRFESRCIPVKTAYRELLEMRESSPSFMIGFIADQRALGKSLKHWTEFMGQPTSFYAGGETIGDRIGAVYVYLDVDRPRRGHYTFTFRPMEVTDVQRDKDFPHTRRFFEMLEETVRRAPAYWLWSHNRWKKPASSTLIKNSL